MGSQEDIIKNYRDRYGKPNVGASSYEGDANSKALAKKAREDASRPGEIERNRQMREAEQKRYYNDPKARSNREAAEMAKARKKSDALKPPRAPMPPSVTPKMSAIQRLTKALKGRKGVGALGLVGLALDAADKAKSMNSRSKKDPRFQK